MLPSEHNGGKKGSSLGDEGWNQLTAILDFGIFIGPEKNSNSTQLIQGFLSR